MPKDLLDQDHINERAIRIVRQIEQGDTKVGDIVFDSRLLKDVVILDLPDPKKLSMYNYKVFPYFENLCRTLDGKIEKSGYLYFVKISKGNDYSTHEIRGKD